MEMIKKIINHLKKYFKKHPYVLVMFIIMGVWMAINIIQGSNAIKRLEKTGKFTIAEIKDINIKKTGKWVTIEYVNMGKKITSSGRFEYTSRDWLGEKIFIKFVEGEYHNWDEIIDIPVPDSLKKTPPTVWDNLPIK